MFFCVSGYVVHKFLNNQQKYVNDLSLKIGSSTEQFYIIFICRRFSIRYLCNFKNRAFFEKYGSKPLFVESYTICVPCVLTINQRETGT